MTYEDLLAALEEFDLPSRATLQEIRERHRTLVRQHHPDRTATADTERISRINAAYAVLTAYISEYRFDFSRVTFLEQYPEERLKEQFSDVGLWGGR